MNIHSNKLVIRVITILLWGGFLLCNLLLVAAMVAQADLVGVLLLLLVFMGELALLLRHAKWVSQWRGILVFWGLYSLARVAATVLDDSGNGLGATLFMLAALYMMFAGWFAVVSLAIRRDVSVPYLLIALLIGPVILRAQVMASGGVLAWLTGQAGGGGVEPFNVMEPVVMTMSCMLALALITFVPHFVILLWREWRGVQGFVSPTPAASGNTQHVGESMGSLQ